MNTNLLLADHRSGWWRTLSGMAAGEGRPLRPDDGDARRATLAEHAGVLRLPAGAPHGARAVFVDDALGTLVVLDDAGEATRIPVAIPGEHLAADPSGRYVVCTTGCGASAEPWSDLVTVADLAERTAVRVRVRTGEPGAAVVRDTTTGEPVVVLRHRAPGEVEAIGLRQLLDAGPHCPRVRGNVAPMTGDLGHGDAVDHAAGVVHLATEAGIERFEIADAVPRRLETWPWPGGGRAWFLRFDPATRTLTGSLRGGEPDPAAWHRWTNRVATWRADDGEATVTPAGDGLVFRPDIRDGVVAWTVVHPDGDRLMIRQPDGDRTEVELPPMSAGPRPGATPWDPVDGRPAQRRAIALIDAGRAAVTRGGDGELHLVGRGGVEATIAVGTPLDEGGHLAALPGQPSASVDGIGR
ncbi:hypothetical protein [Myceligenerans xiligouense]|uniref:Uncharacterized protein n=1 Tax=Myceligenerans xiligouense TaxID=253184 RepID=A0A3N4YQ62_9MICO|nr:hypothetical protein [Myceligenerans xiligouense]RPF20620.1 hypothetical protein EDD34_1217 [Myceligenerans xiligouense]